MKIDLHNHSIFSDGCLTPSQLIDWGEEAGLKAIAITDHNSIGGLDEGQNYSRNKNIEFVPGIEFSAKDSIIEKEFHILGLFVDYKNNSLKNFISNYSSGRGNFGRHCEKMENIIETIHLSRGLAILAHPGFLGEKDLPIIKKFKSIGGDGMEVNYNYFPGFRKEEIINLNKKYKKLALENNLLFSGGGDFHIRKDLRSLGEYGVTEKEFRVLKSRN